jgi:dTDP-6-deoxy-L-talose 4-dehydrogenase (NAD+)
MKKIMVTGAAGFIGRHVLDSLLARDDVQVIACDRDRIKLSDLPKSHRVRVLELDIALEKSDWFECADRPDILIHLAWGELSDFQSLRHFEKELPLHYAFLKRMLSGGLKDLAVAGTCLEYGLKEGMLKEDSPTAPVTAYGLAKDCLRKFLEHLQKQHPFRLKWLRYFYLHGQGQSTTSLLPMLEAAITRGDKAFSMSGGEQLRDFLPVDLAARQTAAIALQENAEGIFNICSGKPISVRELVEEKLKAMGAKIDLNLGQYSYLDYEPMAFWGDNTKLQTVTGDST